MFRGHDAVGRMARCFVSRPLPASAPADRYIQPLGVDGSKAPIPVPTFAPDDDLSISIVAQTYRSQAPGLLRYFTRRTRNSDDAADLMQEAFARLTAHMKTTRLAHPASYLQKIARNLLVDRIRHSRRTEGALGTAIAEDIEISVAPEQELAIECDDAMRLYRSALDALPDKTRQVFIMSRFEELTYKEIAARLGISIPTVQYHFGRALALIAKTLDAE